LLRQKRLFSFMYVAMFDNTLVTVAIVTDKRIQECTSILSN